MPDEDDIRQAAAEHVRMLGSRAGDWLEEQAEIADALEDRQAAKAWRDIADAAKLILLRVRRYHHGR